MTPRDVARGQAAARVAVGTLLVLAPEVVGVPWLGRDARRRAAHVYSAGLGIRDAALGAGTIAATTGGTPARPWVLAGLVADAVDLVATWRNRDAAPALGVVGTLAFAGASVGVSAWLQSRIDQPG